MLELEINPSHPHSPGSRAGPGWNAKWSLRFSHHNWSTEPCDSVRLSHCPADSRSGTSEQIL